MPMNETLFPEYEKVKPMLLMGQLLGFSQKKLMPKKEAEAIWGKKAVKRGITNERQAILKEIQTEMEKDGPVKVKLLAIRLSHVPTEDLYFMLSEGKDYRKRGKGEFSKYIWGSVKPKKI